MDSKYRKEGQAASAAGSVIVLVVGIGIAVLVVVLVGALGGEVFNAVEGDIKEIDSLSISENITTAGANTATLTNVPIVSGSVNIYNGTVSTSNIIPTANFSVDHSSGVVTFTSAYYNATQYNTTYAQSTGSVRDSVINGIQSSFEALEQTGSYMPIIVLAIIIVMVLALIFGFAAIGDRRIGGGSAL